MTYAEQEEREVQLEYMLARGGITKLEFYKKVCELYREQDDEQDDDDGGEYR